MDKLKSVIGLDTALRARNAPLSDKLCQTDSLLLLFHLVIEVER